MTIHVHIERLILKGLPITRAQRGTLGAALEAELRRLMSDGTSANSSGADFSARSVSRVAAPPLALGRTGTAGEPGHARQLGQQIARSTWRGIRHGS
jgi:hypothetical protein